MFSLEVAFLQGNLVRHFVGWAFPALLSPLMQVALWCNDPLISYAKAMVELRLMCCLVVLLYSCVLWRCKRVHRLLFLGQWANTARLVSALWILQFLDIAILTVLEFLHVSSKFLQSHQMWTLCLVLKVISWAMNKLRYAPGVVRTRLSTWQIPMKHPWMPLT